RPAPAASTANARANGSEGNPENPGVFGSRWHSGGAARYFATLGHMEPAVTQLLADWRQGDAGARDRLIGALYPELHRLAEQLFRRERGDHTLQPTALVNEAWLRLSGLDAIEANDRGHLFAVSARLMREILIDHARRRAAAKRDGGERMSLTHLEQVGESDDVELLGLNDALEKLEAIDPAKARIVELRYFGGLSIEETATVVGQSPAT